MSSDSSFEVIVVGAGPVGLLAALLLAQRNVKVAVVESQPQLSDSPRAIVYLPPVIGTLDDAGILEQVKREGHLVHSPPCWRTTKDMKKHAEFDFSVLKDNDLPLPKYRMAILAGQQVLGRIIVEHLKPFGVPILFSHTITDITQDTSSVTVKAYENDAPDSPINMTSAYLLACDGGRSFVRRHFSIPLEGYTHDLSFMSVNLRYAALDNGEHTVNDANFLIDAQPDTANAADSDFGVLIRTGSDGVWRCAYGDNASFSESELRERIHSRLHRILPGHPDPTQYEVLLSQPYRVHQRVASTYVHGRVALAGDAAHLNNPIGGMGLCTGLLDAHAAAVAFTRAIKDGDDGAALLATYNKTRREAFTGTTNPMSIDNLRRLREKSDEADSVLREGFFKQMNTDPEFQREVLLALNGIALGAPGFEALSAGA